MSVLARLPLLLAATLAVAILGGCALIGAGLGGSDSTTKEGPMAAEPGGDRYPDVLSVELRPRGDRVFDVLVTLSSPYDTPDRYADGWQVLDPVGQALGAHTLMHDHAAEQPFTRTQQGLHIPAGVGEVTVQGRDQLHGFGGLTVTVAVPD